jgi:ribonuclease BN (tRNA processing enzyme)
MTQLSVIPLGVGDAFSALYYSSCLAVGAGDKWLLIDCPHPIRKMLKEASDTSGVKLDVGSFSGIALTHLHADHASGLEGFFYFSRFVLKRQPILLAHADVLGRVWPDHLAAGMDCLMDLEHQPKDMAASEYFTGTALSEVLAHEIDGFSIECRKTIHHVPTTAFRIRIGDKSLAYSADTAFDMELIDWLAEADLVIHETNYGVHTPYEKLAELPPELRAKMRLIHYPDSFNLESSVIEPLRQGVTYEV